MTLGSKVICTGVRRVFKPDIVAVETMDLTINPGEFVAILGPSGCGKSTLLRLIAGLDKPDSGRVVIEAANGPSDTKRRADIAYVFQDAHLLPWRSVLGNVCLPLELMGHPRGVRDDEAGGALRAVGLDGFENAHPNQLSGGMRMRASLARAMVTKPKLLLLDEPFAALDEITRQRLDEQLRAVWIQNRMTVIFVTHSITEAVYLADRVIVMSKRPASIVLDRPIALPQERTFELRSTPEFAAQTRDLYKALQ